MDNPTLDFSLSLSYASFSYSLTFKPMTIYIVQLENGLRKATTSKEVFDSWKEDDSFVGTEQIFIDSLLLQSYKS